MAHGPPSLRVPGWQLTALGLDELGIELDCLDAPHKSNTGFDGSFAHGRSWQLDFDGSSPPPDVLAQQLRESLLFVVRHVQEHGPYDGAYGFSQGACIVTLLSDAGVRRSLGCGDDHPLWRCPAPLAPHASRDPPDTALRAPRSFAVLACGVDYLVAQSTPAVAPTLAVPSLHILGEADPYRPGSEALLGRYERPRVLRHGHGHELPLTLRAEAPDLVGAVADFALHPGYAPRPASSGGFVGGALPLLLSVLLLLLLLYSFTG